ncbi:MAG: hypothetical protein ACNA8K_16560 [Cyclonatronaceae bacterium]
MNQFESLKEQWKTQKSDETIDLESVRESVNRKMISEQKKLIFSNLFVSVSFAIVFIVMAWVWTNNPGRTMYFYASLVSMGVLLLTTLAGLWAGVHYKYEDSFTGTREYVVNSIKKLRIRKFMIQKFIPIYMVLLLLCFYFYYADIFSNADWLITLSAYGGTTLFFVAGHYFSRKKKIRQIGKIDEIILDLEQLKNELSFENE